MNNAPKIKVTERHPDIGIDWENYRIGATIYRACDFQYHFAVSEI